MKTAQPLGYENLAVCLLLIALALAVSWRARLGLERSLLVGAARTFLQLTAVGYVLGWIFRANAWYWTLLMLGVMAAAAVHAAASRQERRLPGLLATMAISIAGGSFLVLAIVLAAIQPTSWYDPQYAIPLGGMILGNSLTGAALAVERFTAEVRSHRLEIEARLSLGATTRQAAEGAVRAAVKAAMVPTINAMMVVGLVQLPGMMTGQILAGAAPAEAVRYQMLVMYMLAAAAALTSATAALLTHRAAFTPAHQLRETDGEDSR